MHVRYPHKQVRKTADPRNAEVYNPADVTKSQIFLKQVAVMGVFRHRAGQKLLPW
jgi:hypothetical protein